MSEMERNLMQRALEAVREQHIPASFDLERYPLTVRLWIDKIGEKYSFRFGIHRIGSDRLRSHFIVTGTEEEVDRRLNEQGMIDFLMADLDTLILRWIQSDDDD